jgi:acetyltransferase-like isoleucine patch superfamily enzyme
MIAKWLHLSMKRSCKASLCWMLDWSLFYEPPFAWIKARALNEFLGAKLAPDCILMRGVRSVNWRNISMDSGAYLGDGVNLRSHGPIRIGRWTTIGPEAMLASGGHSTSDLAPTHSPITIGKGVFVGARALILEGVTIGDHAMIGAGAIVVRDVPPLAIAAGSPAKIVAYRDMPERVWTVAGMRNLKGEVLQDVPSDPSCPAFSTHDTF